MAAVPVQLSGNKTGATRTNLGQRRNCRGIERQNQKIEETQIKRKGLPAAQRFQDFYSVQRQKGGFPSSVYFCWPIIRGISLGILLAVHSVSSLCSMFATYAKFVPNCICNMLD